MNVRCLSCVLLLSLLSASSLFSPSSVQAQAWIRDPGSVYVNLGYRTIGADSLYGPDGNTVDQAPYRQHSLALYAEAGIVDRWLMATLDGEVFRRNVLVDEGATTGLGDLRLGLWTGLLEGPLNLSFGVQVGLPTGDPVPQGESAEQDLVAGLLPTGDGEVDVTASFALGYGFSWRKVNQFVQASVGYSLRTTPRDFVRIPGGPTEASDIRDQLVYRVETGIRIDRTFIRRFMFILRVAGQLVVQDRGAGFSRQGATGLGDGVEFTSFGLETLFDVHAGFGLGFGMDGAFVARNVPAAPAYKVSLSYELR